MNAEGFSETLAYFRQNTLRHITEYASTGSHPTLTPKACWIIAFWKNIYVFCDVFKN